MDVADEDVRALLSIGGELPWIDGLQEDCSGEQGLTADFDALEK